MGRGTVRALVAASVVMAVLIVAGVAALATLMVRRAALGGGGVAGPMLLHVPPGTRLVGAAGSADALVLSLQGGGADRVLVVDPRSGRVLRRLELAP